MRKKIVLVTSSQPSLNPRLVKEADALSTAGYEVVVIGQYWNAWAQEADKQLLRTKSWKFIQVGGAPDKEKIRYYITRIVHKLARKLREKLSLHYGIAELSVGRCTIPLYRAAIRQKGDLYIGHNPGGLAPVIKAAKKLGVKCGFDAEDFHRHEYSDDPRHPDVRCKRFLEEKYFYQCDYLTTASPLISEAYSKIFPDLNFHTVLNVFPRVNASPAMTVEKIKLFWFSQTIGHNRGLEEVLEAMYLCHHPQLELHILGYPREAVINRLKQLAKEYHFTPDQLGFYHPIPPDEIFTFAQQFDIGLATEIGTPYNRDICLTNKVFTYIQCGLTLIASDTEAQVNLLKQYPQAGFIYQKNSSKSLAEQLSKYIHQPGLLNQTKAHNLQLGQQQLNWETASQRFLDIVRQTSS